MDNQDRHDAGPDADGPDPQAGPAGAREQAAPADGTPTEQPFPHQAGHGPGASFFDSLRRAGLVRTHERWVGGVAGGIALRLGVDPLLVRGLVVVLTFFGGFGLLLYGLGWALLPEQSDGRIHLQEALRGRFDAGLVGAIALVIIGLTRPGFWWGGFWWGDLWAVIGLLLTIAIVLAVLVWAVPRMRSDQAGPAPPPGEGTASPGRAGHFEGAAPTAAAPPPSSTTSSPVTYPSSSTTSSPVTYPPGPGRPMVLAVLGLALIGMAVVQILGRLQGWDASLWLLGGGLVLTVLGLGILITGIRGRRAGGLGAWSVLTAVLVVPLALTLAVAPQVRDSLSLAPHSFGDVSWTPVAQSDLERGYTHTAGRVVADLGALPSDVSTDEPVEVTLTAGQLVLEIPADTDVHLTVQGTGWLEVQSPDTWSTQQTLTERRGATLLRQQMTMRSGTGPGPAQLEVVASIGAGEIVIRELPATGG